MKVEIDLPDELHRDSAELVAQFASALARKLRESERKYGFTNTWKTDTSWRGECADQLVQHVAKGDPLDVAAYCAFMWHHGWKTTIHCKITG